MPKFTTARTKAGNAVTVDTDDIDRIEPEPRQVGGSSQIDGYRVILILADGTRLVWGKEKYDDAEQGLNDCTAQLLSP